jgi:Domain of unknown function (DUF4956)
MNEFIDMLARSDGAGTISPLTVVFVIVFAFAVGMIIGFIYMWTHEALSYSRTFVGALAMLPLLVSMMMVAMASSLIVAFGLLGVFGVVRFRNVLKDTRDTSFILWSIMEGMALGTMRFSTALLALLGIAAAFSCLRFVSFGARTRYDAVLSLRITGDIGSGLAALKPILKRHATRAELAGDQRSSEGGTDLSYRLLLRDTGRSSDLQSELAGRDNFQNISVYLHDDESEI